MTTTQSSCEPTRRRFLKTAAALSVLGATGDFRSRASAAVGDTPLSPPNETIQKAREAALAVLKPSPKDLEHGFDLHAHSLVFESYESRQTAAERAKIPKRSEGQRNSPRWEALWPEGSLGGRADPSLAWTNWPLFTVGLVQRGYADEAIQKILGGNILRVARAVWEHRA